MAQFIKVVDWGEKQIDLRPIAFNSMEAMPVELHHKTNGSVDGKPSFVMVMQTPSKYNIFGQFSLETLKECLDELGYKIEKK